MRKVLIIANYILAAALICGCAKNVTIGTNDDNKRYLDAWMQVNHPDKAASGLGIFILEEEEGTGAQVTEDGYAIVEYTATDLYGNISAYTSAETAIQMGAYDSTYYYGPQVWLTTDETIQAGLQNTLTEMKAGGRRKVVIPSWLMTYSTYSTAEEYLSKSTDYSNTIYDVTVVDFTTDINNWQIDKMKEFMTVDYGGYDTFTNDTTGFYYKRLALPESDKAFGADTTIYINYTGKLLNGLVFDTTDEVTAKNHGLYNAGKEYKPVPVAWGENHSGITLNGSSVVSGFSLTLWHMKAGEKGVGIFYSPLGYGHSGQGASIPGYAPLVFEIEIVDKPEE